MTHPTLATLHGLTPTQLEAIRGYTTTIVAIGGARRSAADIEPGGSLFSGRMARATLADVEAAAKEEGPHGDGVRFALGLPSMVKMVAEIRTALDSIRGTATLV